MRTAAGTLYTEEQIQWLKDNVKGVPYKELTIMFNKRFNTDRTTTGINVKCKNLKITNGIDGRFKKGQESFNKGKTWNEYMPLESQKRAKTTCFSKDKVVNNQNYNWRNIGDERIDKDGYILVKVGKGKARGQKGWIEKHRLIYEEHYGPIPKGSIVIFKDGNIRNLNIENLTTITKKENSIINRDFKRVKDAQITEMQIDLVRLEEKIKENEK